MSGRGAESVTRRLVNSLKGPDCLEYLDGVRIPRDRLPNSTDSYLSRETAQVSAYPTAEGHQLVAMMERIAASVRRILILRAFAQWLILLFPFALGLLWLDVWLRVDSVGWRWGMAITFVITAIVTFSIQVVPPIRRRISPTMVARRLETTFPDLGDRLSTAVDLSESISGDAKGSDLRSWAIASASRELARFDYQHAVDWRPALRALGVSCLAAILFAVSLLHPATRLAAVHLSLPFAPKPWPREHRLELEVPHAIHLGHDLVVRVKDLQGTLPKDLRLWVKSHESSQESALLAAVSDEHQDVYEWNLPKLDSTTLVRATGGDDQQMAWHTIEVYQGAKLIEQQITITPPEYTKQPPVTLDGGERFEAFKGSRIEMRVAFDKPLKQVDAIDAVSAKILTGVNVTKESQTGTYRLLVSEFNEPFEMTLSWQDERELPNRADQTWRFEIQSDKAPSLVWEQPAQDLTVTSQARLSLAYRAQDDLGLIASFVGSDRIPEDALRIAMPASPTPVLSWQGSGTLDLSQISGLQSGLSFVLTATAVDSANQKTVVERSIQIVDASVIQERVADLQQRAMQSLRRSVTQQRQSQSQIDSARELTQQEAAEQIQSAVSNQSAAKRALFDGPDAANPLLQQAHRLLEQNQIEASQSLRLREWQQRLEQQVVHEMTTAEDLLDAALEQMDKDTSKGAQEALSSESIERLAEAIPHQEKVHQELESILSEMAREDASRQAAFELNEVEREQRQLQQRTRAASSAARPDERLAERQNELARELAHAMETLKSADSREAQAALEKLEQAATSMEMLRAAADLSKGQTQAAAEKQSRIEQSLQAAKEALAGKSSAGGEQQATASIGKLGEQAKMLRDGQRKIVDDLQRSVPANELAGRQHQLIEQTQELVSSLNEERAIRSVLDATIADMQTAAAGLDRGRTGSRVETPARDAWQRLNALVAASESLNETEPEAKQGDAQEAKSADDDDAASKQALASLRLWRELQKWLQSETAALDEATKSADEAQRRELLLRRSQLSEHQTKLAAEVRLELERAVSGGDNAQQK